MLNVLSDFVIFDPQPWPSGMDITSGEVHTVFREAAKFNLHPVIVRG